VSSAAARRALYAALEESLGRPNADTLMMYLPSNTADEAATKADVGRLDDRFDRLDDRFERLEDRFERLEDRFDRLEDRFDRWQRTMYVGQITALTALTAIYSLNNAFFG
jgi:predicted nuclease with TOPRIM domain